MTKIQTIKDLKAVLKDFELMVKQPKYLRVGREIPNFKQRPREAFSNLLLVFVLDYLGKEVTFGEDGNNGDGLIINKKLREGIPVENVSIMDIPNKVKEDIKISAEELIIKAINKKINKGEDYMEGKILTVFFEGIGEFFPNKITRLIPKNNFFSIYGIGLLSIDNEGNYTYAVSQYSPINIPTVTYKVFINKDFDDWKVARLQ